MMTSGMHRRPFEGRHLVLIGHLHVTEEEHHQGDESSVEAVCGIPP